MTSSKPAGTRKFLPFEEPMLACPKWATMQWLPHEVVDVLDARIRILAEDGFTTTRVEAISALVLYCDLADPDLFEELRAYKSRHRPIGSSRKRLRGVPLVLRVPSPITLRMDGLVRVMSEKDQRTYRHELVGTLIAGSKKAASLEELCLRYRKSVAGNAAVSELPARWVLSQKKPRQGARSY